MAPSASYSEMFIEYLAENQWANSPAHKMIVFHVSMLCAQLDAGGLEKAAMSSAYLNAVKELDKRRPGSPTSGAPEDPDQTTIFDHMDDE